MTDMNRRLVLLGGAATASTVALPSWAGATVDAAAAPRIKDPFQLGVASGDPLPDSVVLWTRLAPAPLNPDGLGGMPDATYNVEWEIATDAKFASVVQRGTVATTRAQAHSVHAEPVGLQPGSEYFYRFRVGGNISPVGRTRTAPAPGASVSQLKFAVASSQHWEEGWYHAYRGLVSDQPDLVLFLGDYMQVSRAQNSRVRELSAPADTSLAGYRLRHAQQKTDPNLQAAHAAAPWVLSSGMRSQAFYEHMPVRSSFRSFGWGNLARFHLLDTQQFRTACSSPSSVEQSPATHPSTWDFFGQQMFFAQRDNDGSASTCDSADSWSGYEASRRRITQGWVDRKVANPVVLTGDVHKHWAADLRLDSFAHDAAVVGSELATSSIASDPGAGGPPDAVWFSRHPHVKYTRNQRGYLRVTATPLVAQADFVVVSDALERDPAKVSLSTDARFALQAGVRGLVRV